VNKLPATKLSDLIVIRCPLGCDSMCAQIWRNEVTGHRIICKCSCGHKRVASLVEEPETDAIQQSHLVRRIQQHEKSDNTNYDYLDKHFYNQSSPRYLWTGESWWCHCSHNVSEHKTSSKSPFIANCSGGGRTCLCREFVPYRNISWEDQV
jgi:hypothetical protein